MALGIPQFASGLGQLNSLSGGRFGAGAKSTASRLAPAAANSNPITRGLSQFNSLTNNSLTRSTKSFIGGASNFLRSNPQSTTTQFGGVGGAAARSMGAAVGQSARPVAAANQYSNWLRNQAQLSNAGYESQMRSALAQAGIDRAYYAQDSGFLRTGLGIDKGLINQDRFRSVALPSWSNDRDLDHARRTWNNAQTWIGDQRGFAGDAFNLLKWDVGNRRTFATNDVNIQRWLNTQLGTHNTTQFGLANTGTNLAYSDAMRGLTSDNVARGAMGSRGYQMESRSLADHRDLGLGENQLAFDRTSDNLTADRRTMDNNYNATLHGLEHEVRSGRLSWQQALASLNNDYRVGHSNWLYAQDQHTAQRGQLQSLNQTFDLRLRQAQNDYNRAAASNNRSAMQAAQQAMAQTQALRNQQLQALSGLIQQGYA